MYNIHEPEANNCFSIITQVIIEMPKRRNINLSLLIRVHAARVNVSRNTFFSSRSEKKFFDVDIVVKNKSKCGLSWLYAYRQRVLVFTLFPNSFFSYCFCMLSEFEKVFERKV